MSKRNNADKKSFKIRKREKDWSREINENILTLRKRQDNNAMKIKNSMPPELRHKYILKKLTRFILKKYQKKIIKAIEV